MLGQSCQQLGSAGRGGFVSWKGPAWQIFPWSEALTGKPLAAPRGLLGFLPQAAQAAKTQGWASGSAIPTAYRRDFGGWDRPTWHPGDTLTWAPPTAPTTVSVLQC